MSIPQNERSYVPMPIRKFMDCTALALHQFFSHLHQEDNDICCFNLKDTKNLRLNDLERQQIKNLMKKGYGR